VTVGMKAMIDVNQAFEILRHQRTSFAKGSLRAAEDSSGERDSNAGHEPATFRRNFTSASLPTPTPTELDTARRDLVRRASGVETCSQASTAPSSRFTKTWPSVPQLTTIVPCGPPTGVQMLYGELTGIVPLASMT